jgi:hypothetical protein
MTAPSIFFRPARTETVRRPRWQPPILGHTVTLLEMFRTLGRRPLGTRGIRARVGLGDVLAAVCLLSSCIEEVRLGLDHVGQDAAVSAGGAGVLFPVGGEAGQAGGGGAGTVAPPVDAGPCEPASCGASTYACGDCLDNDADGRLDASDPECLGPCDDSESELSSGIEPRVNGSCRTDCYFDRNAGSGDDGCGWSYRCDPRSTAPEYPPTGLAMCEYAPESPTCGADADLAACEAGCLPLTPNGCDCFGCCELPAQSGRFVWLGSETLDDARCDLSSDDPRACKPCTPVSACQNLCDECELCVGKAELPAACASGLGPVCPEGVRACDAAVPGTCGSQAYCVTGCCVLLPR